jgi:hypothetical protein
MESAAKEPTAPARLPRGEVGRGTGSITSMGTLGRGCIGGRGVAGRMVPAVVRPGLRGAGMATTGQGRTGGCPRSRGPALEEGQGK